MAASEPALEAQSPLRAEELGDAEALVREVGWNQVTADWRIFLELGTVYAIHNGAGRVVATAATLPHDRFAWISMVLVTQAYRRRGLASRLMRHCIDDLIAAGRVPVLDATPDGRHVYRALGFDDTWGFHRLALSAPAQSPRPVPAAPGLAIRPIDDAVWPAICAYDTAAFGADRGALLARLRTRLPQAALYAERDGHIAGLLLGRDGRTATQLGPLIAEDDTAAQALLARALDPVAGAVYVDLADGKGDIRAALAARGFAAQRPLTRMVYRRRESFDDTARTYAVAGPEFG